MNAMPLNVRIRLSVMMFLQYMMFAAWWVQLAGYLDKIGVTGTMKALILSSMALGSLVSPIFGMIADRHFASQKVLMVMNFACAGLALPRGPGEQPGHAVRAPAAGDDLLHAHLEPDRRRGHGPRPLREVPSDPGIRIDWLGVRHGVQSRSGQVLQRRQD